jgi:hypothetical protein
MKETRNNLLKRLLAIAIARSFLAGRGKNQKEKKSEQIASL